MHWKHIASWRSIHLSNGRYRGGLTQSCTKKSSGINGSVCFTQLFTKAKPRDHTVSNINKSVFGSFSLLQMGSVLDWPTNISLITFYPNIHCAKGRETVSVATPLLWYNRFATNLTYWLYTSISHNIKIYCLMLWGSLLSCQGMDTGPLSCHGGVWQQDVGSGSFGLWDGASMVQAFSDASYGNSIELTSRDIGGQAGLVCQAAVTRWSMLLTSSVSSFNVAADRSISVQKHASTRWISKVHIGHTGTLFSYWSWCLKFLNHLQHVVQKTMTSLETNWGFFFLRMIALLFGFDAWTLIP